MNILNNIVSLALLATVIVAIVFSWFKGLPLETVIMPTTRRLKQIGAVCYTLVFIGATLNLLQVRFFQTSLFSLSFAPFALYLWILILHRIIADRTPTKE